MGKAIGMIEFKTVSSGVVAADHMVKTSDVELIEAETVCPGKYIAIIAGDLSAVDAAVNNAIAQSGENLIDSFVLGNPHESIFPAIYGTTHLDTYRTLSRSPYFFNFEVLLDPFARMFHAFTVLV